MDISAVNNLSFEDYFNVFGNVVEKSPFIAAALWSRRPFNSLNDMHVAIDHFIDDLTESGERHTDIFQGARTVPASDTNYHLCC